MNRGCFGCFFAFSLCGVIQYMTYVAVQCSIWALVFALVAPPPLAQILTGQNILVWSQKTHIRIFKLNSMSLYSIFKDRRRRVLGVDFLILNMKDMEFFFKN